MKAPSILLIVSALVVAAGVGGAGSNPPDTASPTTTHSDASLPPPEDPAAVLPPGLSAWTDHMQAQSKREGVAYLNAISEQAKSLDSLSDEALRERLLAQVEPLAEDYRWWRFVHTLMPTDCVRTLNWKQVFEENHRLGVLISLNLGDLAMALRPGSSRRNRQEAVIKIEKEAPVIRELRLSYANDVLANVFETLPLAESSPLTEIRALLRTP